MFAFVPLHQKSRHFIKRIIAVKDSAYTKRVPRRLRSRYDFPPFRAPYLLPDNDAFADYKLSPAQFHAKFPDGRPFTVPEGHVFAMDDSRT